MCFVPNDYLVIATEANNYYLKLNERMFHGKNDITEKIDENMSNEEAINFLTTVPESQKKKTFKASIIQIENTSDQNMSFEDKFRANKIAYRKNLLCMNISILLSWITSNKFSMKLIFFIKVANLVETNFVYVLKVMEENEYLKLKVVESFKGSEDVTSIDSCMSIYEGRLFIVNYSFLSCSGDGFRLK